MGEVDNKVYVGGLSLETTKEGLQSAFEKFGDVEDCIIMADKLSNKSRGFGFVTFKEAKSVDAVLEGKVTIDGRDVTCKKAVKDGPKQIVQDKSGGTYNATKVFVGGLPASCDYGKLTEFFSKYGAIQDAVVMMDQQTQRHRGFGYVTFVEASAVEAAIAQYPDNKIDGKWVEVKRCIPQDAMHKGRRGGGGGDNDHRGGGGDNGYGYPSSGYPSSSDGYPNPYDPYGAYASYYGYGGYPYGAYMGYPYGYPGMPQSSAGGMPPGYPPMGYPPSAYGYPPMGYPGMPGAGPPGSGQAADGKKKDRAASESGSRSRSRSPSEKVRKKRSSSRRRRRRRDRSGSPP